MTSILSTALGNLTWLPMLLSRRPEVESELAHEQPSAEELEEEEWEAVCYSTVQQAFSDVIGGQNLGRNLRE